jgi:hypothetical protein
MRCRIIQGFCRGGTDGRGPRGAVGRVIRRDARVGVDEERTRKLYGTVTILNFSLESNLSRKRDSPGNRRRARILQEDDRDNVTIRDDNSMQDVGELSAWKW